MTFQNMNIFGVIGSVLLVSACGGSDGGSSGALAQLEKGYEIVDKYKDAGPTETMPADDAADATYTGIAAFSHTEEINEYSAAEILAMGDMSPEELGEVIAATSDFTLTAKFSDGTISGSLSNFHDDSGRLEGTVAINGTIVGNGISGNLSGTVDGRDVLGTHDGNFYGTGAAAVGGGMTGTVGDEDFWGLYVGEQ